jgi:hypothetical protein
MFTSALIYVFCVSPHWMGLSSALGAHEWFANLAIDPLVRASMTRL